MYLSGKHVFASCLFFGAAIVLTAQTPTVETAPAIPKYARSPEFRLNGAIVRLPIVMVHEYPFLEGEVAGIKGKLMLDTGAEQALSINDHRIPMVGGKNIGTGHFGSGQTFETRMNERVEDVHVGALAFPKVTAVQSQDARQLERITPDFIGWVGYYFWDGYSLKLDYKHCEAIFYKGGPKEFLKGEKVVGIVPFELRKLPNHPLVAVKLGGMNAVGALDTGQYGALYINQSTKDRLVDNRTLRFVPHSEQKFDAGPFDVGRLHVNTLKAITVEAGTFGAAEPIGITEPNILTLAYSFLSQYKTVWDYTDHRIYLLQR